MSRFLAQGFPRLVALITVAAIVSACGDSGTKATAPPPPPPPPDQQTIGPSGGSLRSRDNSVIVDIPPGAVSQATAMSLVLDSTPIVTDTALGQQIGPAIKLFPDNLVFSAPVTITVKIPPGIQNPASTQISLYEPDLSLFLWQPSRVDLVRGVVTTETMHFSIYVYWWAFDIGQQRTINQNADYTYEVLGCSSLRLVAGATCTQVIDDVKRAVGLWMPQLSTSGITMTYGGGNLITWHHINIRFNSDSRLDRDAKKEGLQFWTAVSVWNKDGNREIFLNANANLLWSPTEVASTLQRNDLGILNVERAVAHELGHHLGLPHICSGGLAQPGVCAQAPVMGYEHQGLPLPLSCDDLDYLKKSLPQTPSRGPCGSTLVKNPAWEISGTVAPNSPISSPPSVLVRDGANQPIEGVTVVFDVTPGSGTIPERVATTKNGVATVKGWIVGSSGPQQLKAYVYPNFVPFDITLGPLLTVTGSGTGSGSVTSDVAGINCSIITGSASGNCSASFNSGTSVTLAATPVGGHKFAGWSGACTGAGSCTLAMTQAQSVTATFTGPVWLQVSPSGSLPPPRLSHTAVFSSKSNRMTIFGGRDGNVDGVLYNDVWTLTNADGLGGTPSWSQVTPLGTPPVPRSSHTAVFSSSTNRMIVFGGHVITALQCGQVAASTVLSDVWVLTNADGTGSTPPTWIQIAPNGTGPCLLLEPTAVFDEPNNRMIVNGYFWTGSGTTNETWVLSNADGTAGTPTWIRLTVVGPAPSIRTSHSAVYDQPSDRMTIFGGASPDHALFYNDVWRLNNATGRSGAAPTWVSVSPGGASAPGARANHTAVYDGATGRMRVYGGVAGVAGVYSDAWLLDDAMGLGSGASWMPPAGISSLCLVRHSHTAVLNAASDRMIIFGGHGPFCGQMNSTWVLTSATGK